MFREPVQWFLVHLFVNGQQQQRRKKDGGERVSETGLDFESSHWQKPHGAKSSVPALPAQKILAGRKHFDVQAAPRSEGLSGGGVLLWVCNASE